MKPVMRNVAMLALATGFAAAAVAAGSQPPSCSADDLVSRRHEVLAEANRLRAAGASCGAEGRFGPAAPLAWNETLARAAATHAAFRARRQQLIHEGPAGETPADRALALGYDYRRVAENLAFGQRDVAAVLRAWAASPSHCANQHDPVVDEAALACARARDGTPYWVMVLGRRLPARAGADDAGRRTGSGTREMTPPPRQTSPS